MACLINIWPLKISFILLVDFYFLRGWTGAPTFSTTTVATCATGSKDRRLIFSCTLNTISGRYYCIESLLRNSNRVYSRPGHHNVYWVASTRSRASNLTKCAWEACCKLWTLHFISPITVYLWEVRNILTWNNYPRLCLAMNWIRSISYHWAFLIFLSLSSSITKMIYNGNFSFCHLWAISMACVSPSPGYNPLAFMELTTTCPLHELSKWAGWVSFRLHFECRFFSSGNVSTFTFQQY